MCTDAVLEKLHHILDYLPVQWDGPVHSHYVPSPNQLVIQT